MTTIKAEHQHIRTKLEDKEFHPSESFAINILRYVPRSYLEQLADHISNELKKEHLQGHPMGVVWASIQKVLNDEPIHGRYLMGLALYVASTVMDVGQTTGNMIAKIQKIQSEEGTGEETLDENTAD